MTEDESSVRVAVRIRPQLPREVIDMCRVCTSVTPNEPQVTLGSDKAFTYDYVFDTDATQSAIYDDCTHTLVQGSLEGYNATVLAYGQTGSGKTYTMGTGFEVDVGQDKIGIIPRAINHIFAGIKDLTEKARENAETPPQFKVTAQFLELYNEDVIDLFDPSNDYGGKGKSGIRIHEDSNHCIYVTGVKSERVTSADEALQLLRQGALSRTTASTQMNSQSSRSHAIFTLHIKQQRLVKLESEDGEDVGDSERNQEFETLTAKFHFVDLAGSERLKRTGATGERAKEGISINCGLLALGNVISALGDTSKKVLHVPYRDSKLTRLLQDSLGGNSRTLMIACVSPSDRDFMETLNTLKYANRARNIQNKVIINQDKSSRTISLLKKEIQDLQLELLEYKQGKRVMNEDGTESVNDMFHENTLLQNEADNLRTRVKGMQETIDALSAKNSELLAEKAMSHWINSDSENNDDMKEIIKNYLTEIEQLRAKLLESESVCAQLRKGIARNSKVLGSPSKQNSSIGLDPGVGGLIELAKKDLQKDFEALARGKQSDNSDEESESESSESEEENEEYSAELANLTSEISIKQQLIDELERAQKRLNNLKQHYEDKLNQLQAKIQATQQERDTVLASFTGNQQPTEKIKKIKEGYEKKLHDMQREMKSLQSAKREHAKLLRNQGQYENQIRTLSHEITDMKRAKVKLMTKIKEEAQRHKEAENRRNREIAQLKKQSRLDANLIRNLEAEKRSKAAILKRKQEEVSALRKVARSRTHFNNNNNIKNGKSPKAAKQKWIALEKNISENTMNKQSIVSLGREMERQIEARTELQEELKAKLDMLKDPKFIQTSQFKEELDTIRESLDHIQMTITDLQHEILQVEETKMVLESGDLLDGLIDVGEAAYIVDKLYNMTLHHSCISAQKESVVRELRAENEQLKRNSEMQEQLLKHLLEGGNKRTTNLSPGHSGPESDKTSRSSSPTDNKVSTTTLTTTWEKRKQRKKTALPEELLFPADLGPESIETQSAVQSPDLMPPPPPALTRSLTSIKIHSVPGSPVMLRKGLSISPRANRKTYIISSNHPSMEQGLDSSPPNSPPVYRRVISREENVFSRLTSQPTPNQLYRNPGKILPFTGRKGVRAPLICSHVVEGHNRAVLALHATEDCLLTASKDRTVVLWDLKELKEVQTFRAHPNNVVSVKYDQVSKLVFSVSGSFVKVWDLRSNKCIKSLSSSGLSSSITNQVGNSEAQMNDIALGSRGDTLYTAAGDRVRMWDLRTYTAVGKLIGGHQAAVMCLALTKNKSMAGDVVVTGSKDHYIKVFDVPTDSDKIISPRVTLEPPHYDGIQCLAVSGTTLFSGSRDCIIKMWDLHQHELVTSVSGAHKDWVTGLSFVSGSSVLVSGCRDGTVKLWSTVNCVQIGELKAHSAPINAIASNNTHIFTASNNGDVKMWKHPSFQSLPDIMTMSTGHVFQLCV